MGGLDMNLKEMTEAYIGYRQSLGEKFKTNATVLRFFRKFAGDDKDPNELTLEECKRYMYYPDGKVTASLFIRHTALKWMFQWANKRGLMNHTPLPVDLPRHPEHMKPYIYSRDELRRLFKSAMEYQKNSSPIYPECMRMILQITYFLGLRIRETMNLCLKDINLQEQYVTISQSKFYKSRIVTFNGQIKELISNYFNWRVSKGMSTQPNAGLFLTKKGLSMNPGTTRGCFERIRTYAGICRSDGCMFQPRLHDLRHTFAVNVLTKWYKDGQDVQKLLPVLSTYLGHTHLAHTSVYLTMTGELLEEASLRFENFLKRDEND